VKLADASRDIAVFFKPQTILTKSKMAVPGIRERLKRNEVVDRFQPLPFTRVWCEIQRYLIAFYSLLLFIRGHIDDVFIKEINQLDRPSHLQGQQ